MTGFAGTIKPLKTAYVLSGRVLEEHATNPFAFRLDSYQGWLHMNRQSQRPAVGRWVTVTVTNGGEVAGLTVRGPLRDRIIRGNPCP